MADKLPPPKEKTTIHDLVDEPVIGGNDKDARLSSGMTAEEATNRAMAWWELKGREIMRQQRLHGSKNAGAFNVKDPDNPNFIPSGIIAGKMWNDLTREEKMRIVYLWHHHVIRVSDLDPEAYLRAASKPWKCFYCDGTPYADEEMPNGEQRPLCADHFKDRYPDIYASYKAAEKANDNGRMN